MAVGRVARLGSSGRKSSIQAGPVQSEDSNTSPTMSGMKRSRLTPTMDTRSPTRSATRDTVDPAPTTAPRGWPVASTTTAPSPRGVPRSLSPAEASTAVTSLAASTRAGTPGRQRVPWGLRAIRQESPWRAPYLPDGPDRNAGCSRGRSLTAPLNAAAPLALTLGGQRG